MYEHHFDVMWVCVFSCRLGFQKKRGFPVGIYTRSRGMCFYVFCPSPEWGMAWTNFFQRSCSTPKCPMLKRTIPIWQMLTKYIAQTVRYYVSFGGILCCNWAISKVFAWKIFFSFLFFFRVVKEKCKQTWQCSSKIHF